MTQWMIINQLEGTAVWFNLTDCPCFLRSTCLFFSSTLSVEMRAPSMAMSTLVESLFSPRASYGNRSVILSLEQLWNNQGRENPTLDWKHKTHRNRTNTTQHLTHSDKAGASSDQLQWMKQAHVYEEGATRQRARQTVVLARHEAKQICSLDGRLILILISKVEVGCCAGVEVTKEDDAKIKEGLYDLNRS